MGRFDTTGVNGDGSALIDGGSAHTPTDIVVIVRNIGLASALNTRPPRRLYRLGWVGLGGFPQGGTGPDQNGYMSWFTFVEFEAMDSIIPAAISNPFYDSVYWSLDSACSVDISVFW